MIPSRIDREQILNNELDFAPIFKPAVLIQIESICQKYAPIVIYVPFLSILLNPQVLIPFSVMLLL